MKVITLIRGDLSIPDGDVFQSQNPDSDVQLNGQKSVEAIVPGNREEPNSRRSLAFERFKGTGRAH